MNLLALKGKVSYHKNVKVKIHEKQSFSGPRKCKAFSREFEKKIV